LNDTRLRGDKIAAIKDFSYTVIFEPLERGGYQAVVPALPEGITAGRTLKEARHMARDAIRCALEGMAKEKAAFPRAISREPRAEKIRVSLKAA
jgi:predicted RNase H-like HicB family nuclease